MTKKAKHAEMAEQEAQDTTLIERSGTAFDPNTQALDLTKDEKRRTTALMMAIQAYRELIIKDADYLREAHTQARQNNGPAIKPATMDAMVLAAEQFDDFIMGHRMVRQPQSPDGADGAQQPAAQP